MIPRHLARLAVIVLLLGAASTSVAEATTLGCGAVVTVNTVLDHDIGPCTGNGIIIGANDVTLNLGGHTVRGTGGSVGIAAADQPGGAPGTYVARVHVLNGVVTGFGTGVELVLSHGSTVERLVVSDNAQAGVSVMYTIGATVRSNVITGNGVGVVTTAASNTTIQSNAVQGNRSTGIFIGGRSLSFTAIGNVIAGNAISGNGGDGVVLGLPFARAQVVGNSITDNAGNGVLVEVYSGDQCCDLIQGNAILRNGGNGVLIQANRPFPVPAELDNRVLSNTALSNGLFDLADENLNCDHNVWAGNTFGTRNQPCIS